MVSPLSSHSLHILFGCILYILSMIWLVLMALLCAAIRRDSVSFLKFPFLSHVQVFSCEMSFISRLKSFFFPFLFPYYCHSIGHRVIIIVFDSLISPPLCYYYYYYYYSSRVFHISISWWFFTRVWVTANLLKSPGLVSEFWPSSAMLSFG